jgi:hypothetical protein
MPTTHAELARAVIGRLATSSLRGALLHPLPEDAGAAISDVDLVISRPLTAGSLRQLSDETLGPLRLTPILVWPYDIDAVALFATDPAGYSGVHLDLVHDRHGLGKLGIRYASFLEHAGEAETSAAAQVDPSDRALYLLRKRHWKGQLTALAELRQRAHGDRTRLLSRAREVLVPAAQRDVTELLNDPRTDPPPFSRSLRGRASTPLRLVRRAARPIGMWAHLENADGAAAELVAARFRRTLVAARSIELTDTTQASHRRTWLREIAPVRWRAGLAVSFGVDAHASRAADVAVDARLHDLEDLCRVIVQRFSERVRSGVLRAASGERGGA